MRKKKELIQAKYYLFHYYNNQFNIPQTIKRAEELLLYHEFLEMKESVFVLYILKTAYNNSKQFEKLSEIAPKYYQQQKKYGDPFSGENKNLKANEEVNATYAQIYFDLKNYKQAQVYFNKYLNYLKSKKEYYRIASSQNNLGLSFFYQKKYDSAMHYFDKALLTINTKVKESDDASNNYLIHFSNSIEANKAKIYIEYKEYDKALPFQYKVIASSKETQEVNIQLGAYYDIAEIFYYKNKPDLSLQYLDSFTNTLKKGYKNNLLSIKAFGLKAKSLMLLGEISSANTFFKQQQNLVDSLDQEEINRKYLQATVKLDVENKTEQLLDSKKLIAEKDKIATYQKTGLILLILFLIVSYFGHKKSSEKSRIIQQQKNIVDKSLKEKEVLLKEIHHRVKNNLQLISSLLNLQSSKHNHKGFKEMVYESQKHINAIALIHEMLYQDSNLEFIYMQKYVEELTNSLSQVSYFKNIKYTIKTNAIKLPINYATTLGLIINELFVNSMKYAFQSDKGTITILLDTNDTNQYEFTYKDNGVGMDKNRIEKQPETLGIKLINMFAEEIDATLVTENIQGLSYTFIFKTKDYRDE